MGLQSWKSSRRRWAGRVTWAFIIWSSSQLSLPLERDLVDPAGERERPLRLVVRADWGDRVAADLERLDRVDVSHLVELALAGRVTVHGELECPALGLLARDEL